MLPKNFVTIRKTIWDFCEIIRSRNGFTSLSFKTKVSIGSSNISPFILLAGCGSAEVVKETDPYISIKSMGNYLDELYGEEYFAIGTDFIISEFQAKNGGSGERQIHTLENHNDLVDVLSPVESNIFYVDFKKASESDELLDIITREQKMSNIIVRRLV